MNISKFSLICLLYLLPLSLLAQKVSPVKVLINGEVEEMTFSGVTDQSVFSELNVIKNGKSLSFDPSEIKGFILENDRYFLSKKIRNTEERYFFQIPLEGEKSIGIYKSNYFLILGDEAVPLTVAFKNNTSMVSQELKRKTYLGVLHYAMDDCDSDIIDLINRTNLSYPSLEKLFVDYHNCKGLPYKIYGESIPFLKAGISMSIGAASVNQKMEPLVFQQNVITPNFEVLLDLSFQKLSPRAKFQVGASYMSFQNTWSSPDFNFPPGREREWYQEEYEISLIKLPVIFNYNVIHQDMQKVYLGLGINYTLVNKKSLSEISQWEFNSPDEPNTIITRPRDPKFLEATNAFGFLGKVGYGRKVKHSWIFAEFQYDMLANAGYTNFSVNNRFRYSIATSSFKVGVSF